MASEVRDLLERVRDLQARLDEAEETLRALRNGEVDALVAAGPDGDRVYTLKGADEAYRIMVQEMADGALTLTVEGLILFSNQQFASMVGLPLERMIGSSIHDFIAPEDASMLSALLMGPGAAKAEVRLKSMTSTLVPVHISANTLLFDDTECVCLIVTDLSEQQRNSEIVAAEWFARAVFEQAAGALLVVDPAGRIIRASRVAEEMAGAAVLLQNFNENFRVRDQSDRKDFTIEEILSTIRRQGSITGLKATVQVPDGRKLDVVVNASLLTGHNSEYLGCIVLLSDVSGIKRAEEAVRHVSEQHKMALEAASMGAWEFHVDSQRMSWDERCAHIFGFSAGQVDYDEVIARIHPDDRAANSEALLQAMAGVSNGAYDREYRVIWPGGSMHWVASHGRVHFAGDGDRRGAVRVSGVSREVTERREAEERSRQTQKLESIGVLAGGVAHDFNNLLTVIMGSASSALEERPSCEYSKAILSAAERAAHLTRQLLAYAGKGRAVLKVLDLTDLVSDTTKLLSASIPKRVKLIFKLSKHLPCLEADPSRIEQILMNLVINSGESIPPRTDGWIEIATSRQEVSADMARQHSRAYDVAAGDYVCLEVCDNGEGMDEATVSRIFDPFFSTKFTGRGLGLAAVHGIVRSRSGFIDVVSSPGAGTTFRVFLPASQKDASREPVLKIVPKQQRKSAAAILVVDDEEMVRKLACMTLRGYGYDVLEAENGRHALQVIAESPSVPSIAILDLAMPIMGGDELLPVLELKYPALKVIISSGYAEEDVRKGIPSRSIAGFLQKPYSVRALGEKVAETLGERPALNGIIELSTQHGGG